MPSSADFRLPPDLVVSKSIVPLADEYWHLPRAVWDPIREHVTGRGMRIAYLDTGYNPDHPAIPQPVAARSFVPSERDAIDYHGHGSHVIGTGSGRWHSIGVAPESDVLVGKVLSRQGSGQSDWIAAGIRWAMTEGANIISLSLGGGGPYGPTQEAIADALAANVICVCATGNDGYRGIDNVNYPAAYPRTLAVASYRKDGHISSFSCGGKAVDVATPGEDIVSCSHRGDALVTMNGTSMATPFFAGLMGCAVDSILQRGGAVPQSVDEVRLGLDKWCVEQPNPDRSGAGIPVYEGLIEFVGDPAREWA